MTEPKLEHCKSCGAPIYWARYRRRTDGMPGGFMPVNSEPDNRPLGGDMVLAISPKDGQLWTEKYRRDLHGETRRRFVPHHVTCEKSHAWRKDR